MRILVIGSGGREHALAWKLSQEAEVIVAPGNAGIAEDAECVEVRTGDSQGILDLCRSRFVDLVVVGPEDPLVAGLADFLRANGVAVYGPGKDGAQLEASKSFSKDLMIQAGVPTAQFEAFKDATKAKAFAKSLADSGSMPVIKASGNALGKGVVVANTLDEAEEAIDSMMLDREFGEAGSTVVVEERLLGYEFSLLSICSGTDFYSLPVAQDYKRVLDGDRGPNTGGMGAYSPVAAVPTNLVREAEESAVRPMLAHLQSLGIDYRGTLFSGFMVQNGKPICLEYNVRFGDPETQSVMRRLGLGLSTALMAAAVGDPIPPVEVLDNYSVTVVVASGGYPGNYLKGVPILLPEKIPANVKVFHAGTAIKDGVLSSNGGRVLGVSAVGDTLEEATASAYEVCDQIEFEGKHYRRDIAASPV
ncbi:MAG: phosphoribosylamine--glycine ligase [Chlorobia bacterium]|nr:phosphoribosylamine--glycine ligase [Fimbriimonadaceae bacterium]